MDHLLKIPIRRISLYDINKNRQEVSEINARMKEVRHHLKHLKEYALAYLDGILEKLEPEQKIRHTRIAKFGKIKKGQLPAEPACRSLPATNYAYLNVDSSDTVSFLRPFARRAASTLRPLAVAIRARKPCLLIRFRREGW